MDVEQEIVVLRSVIGSRQDAGMKPDGIARAVWAAGYRLDPYPNGKSKPELIARIEAVEAERDKTRNLLRAEHDKVMKATYANSRMEDDTYEKWTSCHAASCPVCTFLAETSSVKL